MKQKKRYSSFLFPLVFAILIWAVKLYEIQNNVDFGKWGIHPKTLEGLKGIIFSPFIHGDFNHLMNNTLPAIVLGTSVFFFYREVALKIIGWSWLITGLWVWVAARPSYHIGASGVIYALASFLFFSGVIRKNYKLMSISLLVVFLYGGMVWGVFPIKKGVSWESHLFGSIAGLYLAFHYRKLGEQRKRYDWEFEDDEDDLIPENQNEITINYIYSEDENKSNSDTLSAGDEKSERT